MLLNSVVRILVTFLLLFSASLASFYQIKLTYVAENVDQATSLLRILDNCVAFIFNWNRNEGEQQVTRVSLFYSQEIYCSVLIHNSEARKTDPQILNERYRPNSRQPARMLTRLTRIRLSLYYADVTRALKVHKSEQELCTAIWRYNIDPTYILIWLSPHEKFNIFQKFLQRLVGLSFRAPYLIINGHVYLLRTSSSAVVSMERIHRYDIKSIERQHELLHRDFLQAKVQLNREPSNCGNKMTSGTSPNTCAIHEVISKRNLSYFLTEAFGYTAPWDGDINSGMINLGMFSTGAAEYFYATNYSMDWMIYGEVHEPFTFASIVDVNFGGTTEVFQIFDPLALCACFLTGTIMSIVIALLLRTSYPAPFITRFKVATAFVVFLVIDQFRLPLNAFVKRPSARLVLATFAWAWMAVFVNTKYKGTLVSTFTAPIKPQVPQDIHELSYTQEMLLTTHRMAWIFNDKEERGDFYVRHKIEKLLDKVSRNDTLAKTLRRLVDVNNVFELNTFGRNDSKSTQIQSDLPKRYHYLGTKNEVQAYRILYAYLKQTERDHTTMPGKMLSIFDNKRPIIVRSNMLSPIVCRILAQLQQSGLWSYWDVKYFARKVIDSMSSSILFPDWEQKSDPFVLNRFKRDMRKVMLVGNYEQLLHVDEAQGVQSLLQVLLAFVTGLGLAGIIFLGEVFAKSQYFQQSSPWKALDGHGISIKINNLPTDVKCKS